jgi:hypothetical protein
MDEEKEERASGIVIGKKLFPIELQVAFQLLK